MRSVKFLILSVITIAFSFISKAQYVQPGRYDHYSFTNQVNVGAGVARVTAPSAYFEVGPTSGGNKGFLAPRLSTTERNSIVSPADGLMIYNSTTKKFNYYDGGSSTWKEIGSGAGGGSGITQLGTSPWGLIILDDSTYMVDSMKVLTKYQGEKMRDSLATLINAKISSSRTITINGVTQDLSADRSWTVSGGSTYTFTQGLTKNAGDSVKIDNLRLIPYLVKQTSGSSLSAGWSAVGTPTYSVSSGNWLFNSNDNSYTKYIRADTGVLADKCYLEVEFTLNTIVSTSEGPKLMFKSFNPYTGGIYQHDVAAGYRTGSSASNYGKAYIYGKTGASYSYSDSARTSSNGDAFRWRLDRDGLSYTITISNLTKGWYLQKVVNCTPAGSPFVPHNASYPAFVPGQDDITVTSFKYVIKAPLVTKAVIGGNSIMMGQGASVESATAARNVGNYENNIVMGGGADGTAELLKCLGEIIAIKPEMLILGEFAGNDPLFGVSSAVWQFNINRLHDEPIAAGIPVVMTLPTPRTTTDESALKNYIDTSSRFRQSLKVSGTWDDLVVSGTQLKTTYTNDGGTHPNTAGQMAWAAAVNKRLHIPFGSDGTFFKKFGYAADGYLGGTDAGTGADQYKAAGLLAFKAGSTSSYGGIGFISDYMYLMGVIEGSEYTKIVLSPGTGSPRIGIGEISPSAPLVVKNTVSGTTTLVKVNHGGSFSAVGQEFGIEFQNAGTSKTKIVSYLDPDGLFGMKFYGEAADGSNVVSTRPTFWFTAKDSATFTSGKLTIGKNLYITGAQSGVGDKSVRFNSSTKEVTYVDTIKTKTFTPTLTNTTNIDSSRAYVTNYTVVGDMIHVWGIAKIDATAAGTITEMGMSLPFAAGIAQVYDLSGTAAFEDGTVVQIKGDNANGRAMWRWKALTDTDNTYSFHMIYKWVAP